jgi:hypothetical protein
LSTSVYRVAAPALDHEVGRTISGTGRRHGHFPSNLSWEGAELSVSPQQAKAWIKGGEAARGERPPSEVQQQALAALLHPIANISRQTRLYDLGQCVGCLRFREVMPPLGRSSRGLWGVGEGMNAWQRLEALRWIEFQVAAGKVNTMTNTYEIVAREMARFTPSKHGAAEKVLVF